MRRKENTAGIYMKFRLSLPGSIRAPASMGLSAMGIGGSVRNDSSGVVGDRVISPTSEWRLGNDTVTGTEGEVFVERGGTARKTVFGLMLLATLSSSPSSMSKSSPFAHRAPGDTVDFDCAIPTLGALTE